MADLKHQPVRHDHAAFLARARQRKGFADAYDALALEYALADQMLRARARAGLTQDAVAERSADARPLRSQPRCESSCSWFFSTSCAFM